MSNNPMPASRQHPYNFETHDTPIRTTERAQAAASKFLARIKSNIDFDTLPGGDKILITEYMIATVLNIEWYKNRIEKERRQTIAFFALSMGLLLVLPIVLFGLSFAKWETNDSSFDMAGLVVAVLSSIIAFQKVFSEWYKKRLRKGQFWRAMAKIKENLYQLEGEQTGLASVERKGRTPAWVLKDEFRKAVRRATAECRKIASDEQQSFFDQETLPDLDLANTLTSAKTDATGLLGAFRSQSAVARAEAAKAVRKSADDLAAAESAVAKSQAAFDAAEKLVRELSQKVARASAADKPDLEARLTGLKAERDKTYAELLASQLELARQQA